jgi:hypothetical protein
MDTVDDKPSGPAALFDPNRRGDRDARARADRELATVDVAGMIAHQLRCAAAAIRRAWRMLARLVRR